MFRLFLIMYSLAGTALAGAAIVAVLTMNMFDMKSVIAAAIVGALAGIPAAWIIAKKIAET
ncbi:MAG: CTP synthetase [Rhodobacteraceae bacterium]|nr:CTP synthetase [Paracoccaceae bacterium]